MKFRPAFLAVLLAAPVLVRAHPGHDGDHDFVWDFEHLATHPLATAAYVVIGGVAAWLIWRRLKAAKSEAARERTDRRC